MKKTEPWLYEPKATAEILKKYDFRFKKRFGQNFLIDGNVIKKIIAAADISGDDFILEIGPGIGTLTQFLACEAGRVAAVEIDEKLIPVLEETLCGYENVRVINADILKLDIKKLIEEENGGRPIKVIANLPYYITTPVITELLESEAAIASLTVMIQKEVAARIAASAGTKDYGALTLAVAYHCETEKITDVSPNCFIPRPEVTSAVIRLDMKKDKTAVGDEKLMFRLIKAAFAQRRKTLMNAMRNSGVCACSKEEWEEIFKDAGIDGGIRGETLELEDFARLADETKKRNCRAGSSDF